MADNLSVAVTADTSELRAQWALAQADMRAVGAETRKLATDIRAGGDASGVLRGQLGAVAGQFNGAKSNVVSLTAALRDHKAAHEEAASGIRGVNEALEGMTAPLTGAVSGLGKMAEILGVAFAVERLTEFAKEMGELGERTLNMAAAVGTTPEKFSLLSTEMQLAGANAETASRTLERLGKNLSAAIANPTSEAGKAFKALGISQEELKKASTDLEYGLRLLAEKFTEFQDTPNKTAAYMAILGRGMENLIPYFPPRRRGVRRFCPQGARHRRRARQPDRPRAGRYRGEDPPARRDARGRRGAGLPGAQRRHRHRDRRVDQLRRLGRQGDRGGAGHQYAGAGSAPVGAIRRAGRHQPTDRPGQPGAHPARRARLDDHDAGVGGRRGPPHHARPAVRPDRHQL